MAIFILVHGGGHGGWCYKPLSELLHAHGHEVHASTLSGLGDRAHVLTPETGLATHIADVVGLLDYQDLRDVILVGHSYGGMVVTGAADARPGRIGHIVYLDAAIPRDGEALVDVSPGLRDLAGTIRTVDGVDLVLWPEGPVLDIYGLAGTPFEQWALQRLTPHPWRSLVEPLLLRDAMRLAAIPRTIINCTGTLAKRPLGNRDRWIDADRVWEIDTGHDLMLTEPDAVAEMLLRLC